MTGVVASDLQPCKEPSHLLLNGIPALKQTDRRKREDVNYAGRTKRPSYTMQKYGTEA